MRTDHFTHRMIQTIIMFGSLGIADHYLGFAHQASMAAWCVIGYASIGIFAQAIDAVIRMSKKDIAG